MPAMFDPMTLVVFFVSVGLAFVVARYTRKLVNRYRDSRRAPPPMTRADRRRAERQRRKEG